MIAHNVIAVKFLAPKHHPQERLEIISVRAENIRQRLVQGLIRHLAGKIIPEFRRDELCRLRLLDNRGDHIIAIQIAGAAQESFFAVIMNARTVNEHLRFLIQ